MKHTKSMVINPTVESHELLLFTTNESSLYPSIKSYIKNLANKYQKNIYSSDKAIDGFYTIATNASELYNRYYGYKFTVTERYNAAIELESYYLENIQNNDY